MDYLKLEKIFEILNIKDREDLLNKIVCIYEYTFKEIDISATRKSAIEMIKTFDKELSHVQNLKKLFLGIYLHLTLEVLKDTNVIMIQQSIKKSLMQINVLSIEFLTTQISIIEELLEIDSLNTLIERPAFLIKCSDDIVFKSMAKYSDDFIAFFRENISNISNNAFKSSSNFSYKENKKYISKEDILLELWIVNLYKFIDRELISLLHENKDDYELDLLSNYEFEKFLDKSDLKNYSLNFVKSISNKNIKNIKYMIEYIYDLNLNIIKEIFDNIKNTNF